MTTADRIRALLKQGLTDAEIVRRLGCTRTYVRAVRSRSGIPAARPEKRGLGPGPRFYRRKTIDGSHGA